MNGIAYYNENDRFAAAWLRELISAGHVAPGDVDERSIKDVQPADVAEYTQCHFFAGIGGWSYALRLAGWPDDRSIWTGSCPCQPFSGAGEGKAENDPRHLWPDFYRVIRECKPAIVFGEQVASKAALRWLDGVFADLEGSGYACGAADLCAASIGEEAEAWIHRGDQISVERIIVGAPHIRQRLYWLADATAQRPQGRICESYQAGNGPIEHGVFSRLEHSPRNGRQQRRPESIGRGTFGGRGISRLGESFQSRLEGLAQPGNDGDQSGRINSESSRPITAASAVGAWSSFDILHCRDEKSRRVESASQRMVDGFPDCLGRVGAETIAEIEKEIIAYAKSTNTDRREALLDVWKAHDPKIFREKARRSNGIFESTILLAYLRQLSRQGWPLAERIPCQGQEALQEEMRKLWRETIPACPSCESRLDGQPEGEFTNPLQVLSSFLARNACQAWDQACNENAKNCFPLIHGSVNRVGRLRGYGNAMVPQEAATFIGTFLEIEGEK